jgi:protein-disulfide isomerase
MRSEPFPRARVASSMRPEDSAARRRHPPARRGIGLVVSLAITFGLGSISARAQAPAVSQEAIESIVREYLLSHPEVIMESLRRAQEREQDASRAQARLAVQTQRQALLQDPESPVGGNPAGDVTIVEFFDYRCPYCRRMAPLVKILLAEDPGLRLVYKELPILGPESVLAARAALAARGQGKYLEAHDLLIGASGPFTPESLVTLLAGIGVDGDRLRADMEAPQIAGLLRRELALAEALRIDGTPAFVVGSELVVGAVDIATLRDLVSKARRAP